MSLRWSETLQQQKIVDEEESGDEEYFEMSALLKPTGQQQGEGQPLLSPRLESTKEFVRQPSQIVRLGNKLEAESGPSVDPLFNVVDKIEDELDMPYEDLVPLEVKLALEEKVFGWSHLSSEILGHIFFTAGAYAFVFALCTGLLEGHMPEWLFRLLRFFLASWAGISTFRMVRRRRRVWLRSSYGSKDYEKDALWRKESIRDSDRNTILGRIRRKRAAMAERKHQKKLLKASRRFSSRQQRHRDQLLKQQQSEYEPSSPVSVCHLSDDERDSDKTLEEETAALLPEEKAVNAVVKEVVFNPNAFNPESPPPSPLKPQRRKRRGSFHAFSKEETKSIGHDEILFAPGPLWKVPYAHGGFFGAAPFMLANPHWIDVLRLLMPDVYIEISRRVLHAPAPRLIHWAENNPVVAAYGTAHELENFARVPNIEWDVFVDPHLVRLVEVVFEEEEKFLRSCVPDVLQSLSGNELRKHVLASSDTIKLTPSQLSILQFYEKELQKRTTQLVDKMLIAHGNLTQLVLEQTGYAKKYNFSRVKRTRRTLGGGIYAQQWLAIYAEALKLGMCLDGGSSDSSSWELEQDHSFSSTTSLSPTPSQEEEELANAPHCDCLQCDACMMLARSESNIESADRDREQEDSVFRHRAKLKRSNTEGSPALRERTSSVEVASSTRALTTSIAESINLLKGITRCDAPVGLVFDIKSRHVPHRVWGLIVDTMRVAGARVEGVASFTVDEIRDISQFTASPVREILFFHSAGDMQSACHQGQVKPGDTVFFNAGSLLWQAPESMAHPAMALFEGMCQVVRPFDPEDVKRNYQLLPFARVIKDGDAPTSSASTIQQYKEKFNLTLGLYCQEFSIDEAAVNILVKYANESRHVFHLGLCWGGVNGLTLRGIQPGRFTSTDGFWNQRYAGVSWDPSLSPQDIEIANCE